MKRKTTFLKSLLVAVGLLAGVNGAWAADKTVVKYSFDDVNSPKLTAGKNATFDYTKTSVISNTVFLNIWGANNTNSATNIPITEEDLSGEQWTLVFDWAGYGGCNKKTGSTVLSAGETTLFTITDVADWNSTMTLTYGSGQSSTISVYPCNKSNRISANTGNAYNTTAYWLRFTVTGSADGVKLTIAPSNGGDAILSDAVLSATNVTPTQLAMAPGSCGALGIDELSLSYYVEGEVVQTPTAAYTAVNGISRTITATCDTEGATILHSTDGTNYEDGASVTVDASTTIYFKAVKGTTESDVLEFNAVAGEAITLITPTINRTSDTRVVISADQSSLLLSPTATIYYTYGEEAGSFTGSKELTVAADDVITAYAEATGYTTSATAERAVALFPTAQTIEATPTRTSGWSASAFSNDTITVSDRKYVALLLDGVQWGNNVYLQANAAWGLRATGNWYINDDKTESWMLMRNMKAGDIIVVNVTYPASSMVNATYSKYSYGERHAYEVTKDGDVELAFKKINAGTMDYFYGVYAYRIPSSVPVLLSSYNAKSFSSDFALDFSAVTKVKAWVATAVAADKVTMQRVTGTVAGGTGLIITAGQELSSGEKVDIPVVATGDVPASNLLVAGTGAEAPVGSYVLAAQNNDVVFAQVAEGKQPVVDYGQAYLSVPSSAKTLTLSFEGNEATGINSVSAEKKASNDIFNLAGQRVAAPQKGLYIMNGKKVIVK